MNRSAPLFLALVVLAIAIPAGADDPTAASKKKTRSQGKATKSASHVAPEREAAVVAFVQQHHPELNELLRYLRTEQPKQYERALADLYRSVDRLGRIRDRDEEQYEIELSAWRLRSRIELLVAQYKMTPGNVELEHRLRSALAQQVDARRALLELQQQRMAEKLKRMDSQIHDLRVSRDAHVEQQFKRLTGRPGRRGADAKQDKPANVRGNRAASGNDKSSELNKKSDK